MEEIEVGKITHHFSKIEVGVIQMTTDEKLKKGDTIHIKGATTDFEQKVESMQINHKDVPEAKKGESFGLKVKGPVREHDAVYKVVG